MLIAVEDGELWLGRKWTTYIIQQLIDSSSESGLSKRECEVLNLLQLGMKNRDIAETLGISEETLRWHLRRLYAKTKCQSRNELIHYAKELHSHEYRVAR